MSCGSSLSVMFCLCLLQGYEDAIAWCDENGYNL